LTNFGGGGGDFQKSFRTRRSWDDAEFARHCARLRQLKQERGWLTEAEWDDLESELQIAAFRRAEERKKKRSLPSDFPLSPSRAQPGRTAGCGALRSAMFRKALLTWG